MDTFEVFTTLNGSRHNGTQQYRLNNTYRSFLLVVFIFNKYYNTQQQKKEDT